MNRLPVEVCTRIFSFACVDGGRTGCAIADVCRYFYRAVLPVQLHSVALLGSVKMTIFLTRVLGRRSPAHHRVRHLFLAKSPTEPASCKSSSQPERGDELQRILVLLGPDIITLTTLLSQPENGGASVLCHPFPQLEELTIHGYTSLSTPVKLHDVFPSLQRLHILSALESTRIFMIRAPNLTHLRLCVVWSLPDKMYDALECFLSGGESGAMEGTSELGDGGSPPFPPSLESVVLALQVDPDKLRVGYPSRVDSRAVRRLQESDHEGKLWVIDQRLDDDFCKAPSAIPRRNWEDRIVGKGGCWAIPRKKLVIMDV